MIGTTPPPIGSLVQYSFGKSRIFGIIISVLPPPDINHPPPLYTFEILEVNGRKTHLDIHELDILTDKLQVIQ